MDPENQSSWRRLPDPGESPPAGPGPGGRDRGIRRVQRTSNAVAAALVVATAAAIGYFVQADVNAGQPAAPAPGAAAPGAAAPGAQPGTAGRGAQPGTVAPSAQPGTPAAGQPCVTAPVATSGGSGATAPAPAPAPTCTPGAPGTPGVPGTPGANGANGANGASPGTNYVKQNERDD